jgi:hypothetical protein
MTTTTLEIFHKVARREISSREGAEQLVDIESKDVTPSKPAWMPKWVYVVGVAAFIIVMSPFTSHRN